MQALVDNDMHISRKLAENDELILKHLFEKEVVILRHTTTVHETMQKICGVTLKIQGCKDKATSAKHREKLQESLQLIGVLKDGFRVPNAVVQTIHEIDRRHQFKFHYEHACRTAITLLSAQRTAEIERRKIFHTQYSVVLQPWIALRGMDDYPHTCVAVPKAFDTQLPAISKQLATQCKAMLESLLQKVKYTDHQRSWCLKPIQVLEPSPRDSDN